MNEKIKDIVIVLVMLGSIYILNNYIFLFLVFVYSIFTGLSGSGWFFALGNPMYILLIVAGALTGLLYAFITKRLLKQLTLNYRILIGFLLVLVAIPLFFTVNQLLTPIFEISGTSTLGLANNPEPNLYLLILSYAIPFVVLFYIYSFKSK